LSKHRFKTDQIDAVYQAIFSRRDMRHFRDTPIAPALLKRLITAAHHAPSVGYMQPWRFIRISDRTLRQQLYQLVQDEREQTAQALADREDAFRKIKVEGIKDCGEVLVVTLDSERDKHIFGRRTLPQMDLASAACAIQNIWLAARAEGLGMGWVSIFDPNELATLLKLPEGSQPIAILCLGYVDAFYDKPMLELEQWAKRENLNELLMENHWGTPDQSLIDADGEWQSLDV
jgi:5,6-dimethylbenzimidazole synthase